MAISNLGAINSLPTAQIPAGYTLPVVATFADFEYVRTIQLLVLKATVEAATSPLTMAAIFNNATVGINKQVADIILADFLTTPNVTTYASLVALDTNINVGNFSDDTYLKNTAVSYKCTVNIYVKAL
jgi:hypothetical protein